MLFLWGLSPTVSPASPYAGVLNLGCARCYPKPKSTSLHKMILLCARRKTHSLRREANHQSNSVIKRVFQLDIRIRFWYANMSFLLIHDVAQ